MLALLLLAAAGIPPPHMPQPVDRAWTLLDDGLNNKDAAKRSKAVHALGLIHNSRRAQTLAEKALVDMNKEVRVEAATALGRLGSRSAAPKLHQALRDPEVKVVIAAANALYQLKDPAAFDIYYALLTGERKSSEGLVQSQLDTLRDRKQVEKLAFEAGIGFVPFGGLGYEAWKTITRDDTSPVRAAAAERLATDPDPKSASALTQFCSDKKWQVRAAVVHAIAERRDRALLDPVISLMDDENDNVRYDAAATVVELSASPRRK
jgi:HEAT repeat protein